MRFFMLCKRHYTNKDLIDDRFGRLYHLPVELGKNGQEGLVVAADYRSTERDSLATERVVFRTEPLSARSLPSFASRIFQQARDFKPDVILASGDIHFGAIGLWAARRLGVPFVFDVYDNYAAFASARILGFRSLFHRTLRQANLVVCVGEPLEGLVHRYNNSTVIIPNGVDRNLFKPMDRAEARSTLGISDTASIVGYFGAIGKNRGVDLLVEAIRLLWSDGQEIRLLLAGPNEINLNLREEWIDYRGVLPQDQIPILVSACDVGVVPYLSDSQVEYSNANKIVELIACGVPIVSSAVSDYATAFGLSSDALFEPGDAIGLARAIGHQLAVGSIVSLDQRLVWPALGEKLRAALAVL